MPIHALLLLLGLAPLARPGDDPAGPRGLLTSRPNPLILPLPPEGPGFQFAIFGDRTGGPSEGIEVLRQAVADVNLLAPDLVMTVGDLVQGYNARAEWLEQMREFKAAMGGLSMPWFPVAGNHDIYWRGPDRPAEEHEGDYEAHFGPLWYAFEHKRCWFFALYTDEADPASGQRDFNRPESQRMSPEQFDWLDRTLEAARTAEHVFVFVHHPRWLSERYGGDWERVHRRLAQNGNVSAVFGGHIHRMRYDGRRDGIEYFTLATVGGHQEGYAAGAGYLHQYHLVSVRPDGIHLAAYPVGAVLDPRAITGALSEAAETLARQPRPRFSPLPQPAAEGRWQGQSRVALHNPTDFPLELRLSLDCRDAEWLLGPEHQHARLEPGATGEFALAFGRRLGPGAELSDWPVGRLERALVHGQALVPLPAQDLRLPPPAGPLTAFAAPARPACLRLDGRDDGVRVESDALALPEGPFTLEVWVLAEEFSERQGLVAKTESAEFGLFASGGRASFSVHLDGSYATAQDAGSLAVGVWTHLAGVFDGAQVRLFVDGRPVARRPATGSRTRNDLPLLIGGDVDASGALASPLRGALDEVLLSRGARYAEPFSPDAPPPPAGEVLLSFGFDERLPGWALDRSGRGAHGELLGGARLEPAALEGGQSNSSRGPGSPR